MNYTARVERLRAQLEEPLLVTNPINVFYLTGFKSTNPALLVDEERVQLFTDFRYAEAARGIADVEFVETKRAIVRDLAARLDGRVAFEADFMPYATAQDLAARGLETVPRSGLVESLRAVKDDDEVACIRRACEITDGVFEA